MANKAKHLNAESCISNSVYYDRPDHSILSDFNYLNNIKESISSNYYNETTVRKKYENSSNFSVIHLNIRSVVSHFTEFICYLGTLYFEFKILVRLLLLILPSIMISLTIRVKWTLDKIEEAVA